MSPPPQTGHGIKIALALSLAVNLAVAGTVGGVVLRSQGGGNRQCQVARDLNFCPHSNAPTRPQRRMMLGLMGDAGMGLRDARANAE